MTIYLDRPLIETLKDERSKERVIETVLVENPRLALYLPFRTLKEATENFKTEYLKAWLKLLTVYDVRESFNFGDIYEPEARKTGLEYVVKATHLIPYLLKYRLLSLADIQDLLEQGKDDELLKQGITEGLSAAEKLGVIKKSPLGNIKRKREAPLFNSDRRQKWIKSLGEKTKARNLTGNYLSNLKDMDLPEPKSPDQILIIGGSRLKGYGRENSDLDIFTLEKNTILDFPADLNEADPRFAHLVFNTVWIGEKEYVEKTRREISEKYYVLQGNERKQALEKIEQDLLQYRLMHRFHSFSNDVSKDTRNISEIDGKSAFFDERYREIATELFLSYVYLPTKNGVFK